VVALATAVVATANAGRLACRVACRALSPPVSAPGHRAARRSDQKRSRKAEKRAIARFAVRSTSCDALVPMNFSLTYVRSILVLMLFVAIVILMKM
jgi:hypothetical protein